MFVGYGEHKSDCVRMWDPSTMRVVVTRDVIWLKQLNFQPDDVTGVLELDTTEDFGHNDDMAVQNNLPLMSGGKLCGVIPL